MRIFASPRTMTNCSVCLVRICQARLMLIRDVASRAITALKGKADETYTRMYDWLGEKYKQETESIENMTKIIRYAIESKEKIQQQLVLDKYSFFIAEVKFHRAREKLLFIVIRRMLLLLHHLYLHLDHYRWNIPWLNYLLLNN